ncbi:MAG: Ig-like domain-containing protein [Firmicutes bacterium]|nr:Ig-like domain-containing protein [Bacillota bacterium]
MIKRGKKKIISVVLTAALVFTTVFGAGFAYAGSSVSGFTGTTYTHNSRFDDRILMHGVDVSTYQNGIDWNKAKAAGVDFAIIRIGFRGYGEAGRMQPDDWFVRNIEAAKAAGVMVGVYFFSQALNTFEARAEAKYTLDLLGDYELDLPIFMDYEFSPVSSGRFTSGTITKIQATANVRAFCDFIQLSGYQAGLYANLNFLNKTVDGEVLGQEYPIWVAQYYNTCNYDYEYDYWQYSSGGNVNGIGGRADVNFLYLPKESKRISDKSLADCEAFLTGASNYQYSAGTAFTPGVSVSHNGVQLTEGVDYNVRYVGNSSAGTAYAMIIGKGMYTDYKLVPFHIEPSRDLSGITIKQPKDRKYTGSVTKPSYITVTDASGRKLTENLDYTYTVANAVEVGQADLIVSFMGNLQGTKTVKYNIVKATQSITVSDARTSTNLSAGAYKLGASAKYADAKLTYSSSNPSVASVSSSGTVTPKAAGTTTLTINAAATSEYGTATKTISLTIVNDVPEPAPTPDPEPEQPTKPDDPNEDNAEAVKNAQIKAGIEATKVVSLKAADVGRKRVKLTWKKSNSGYRVDAYQIWRSTKKSSGYTKIFTSTSASHKYYINTKGLEPGKTYWYKVRGIRRVDGKLVYTPFTKISVTTKK